ncbi:mechanosensitive ion channel family protein [Pedobacter sp. GSP4]|uniref:mechanosensitive ion channel family protein n=1 Tax=Pedobacter sp. GSP4 TaxID=3453716 RepID=UPI003EE8A644
MKIKAFLLILILMCTFNLLRAQKQDSLHGSTLSDSLKQTFVQKMQDFAKRSAKKSKEEFEADKATIDQIRIFEQFRKTMQKARNYLNNGLDTPGIKNELKEIDDDFVKAGDGVFTNKGTAHTFRNLTATSKILAELLKKANARKISLDANQQLLNNFRYQLDSLSSEPALFKFPQDSVSLMKYLNKVVLVAREVKPVDSMLKIANSNIQSLLNQVNVSVFKLQNHLEDIEFYQQAMADNGFKREFGNLLGPEGHYRPFGEILANSWTKGLMTLGFYAENNYGKLLTLMLLVFLSFTYLKSLKNIYKDSNLLHENMEGQLVIRYPFLSALLIVISIFQFIFQSPPFILNAILWISCCIALSIIFKRFINKYWMNVWLAMVVLFGLAVIDNLILQASRTERWVILIISATGIFFGVFTLLKGKRDTLREKWIVYSIALMVFLESMSVLMNLLGRYNLAKTFFIGGYLNVVVAILFLWTVRLINEGLNLAFNIYAGQDKKLFYLNFSKVGKRAPLLFYALLIIGWLVLFGRNFPAYSYFSKPLKEFFTEDRTIGDYTFSINTLLLFVVIIVISVIVSKVVSFFASDKHLEHNDDNKRYGIGSWLLLVRIAILAIGLFLAVAAAGIPIDRITIILGALGVGIGFGLQTLVNNLASGLIIAFEKPVNVGDIVDVDGQAGTMKSIGFRSSVISTWDGADVVMPNGDLLNAHLINWSLGGNRKRISINVNVAYNSDLQKIRAVLMDVLSQEERIIKSPAPAVQYEQFADSAIGIKIYFWTKQIGNAANTKSDLIVAINEAFKTNDIIIPYQKQDITIHYPKEKE